MGLAQGVLLEYEKRALLTFWGLFERNQLVNDFQTYGLLKSKFQ